MGWSPGGGLFPPWSVVDAMLVTFEAVKDSWPDGGAPPVRLRFVDGGT
jgi:hypothetical protein